MSNQASEIAFDTLHYLATYPVVNANSGLEMKEIAISAVKEIKEELTGAKPTAENVLKAARDHIAERGNTYDSEGGERSMNATVEAFNVITGHDLKESQGWLFMAILKAVRANQKQAYHADSFEDMAAYVGLAAEAKAGE